YTNTDSTAFVSLINQNGTSYLNGGPLQVNGGSVQTLGYFYGSVNNFNQLVVHNTNPGTAASADIVACNDKSALLWPLATNCATYYVDFGINSSLYNQAGFTGESAGDGFVNSSDSNLDLESGTTTGKIFFITGGTLTSNIQAMITNLG